MKKPGRYEQVYNYTLLGNAGDVSFQTTGAAWGQVIPGIIYGPFGYAMPTVQAGATRWYRFHAIYSDNITNTAGEVPRLRILRQYDGVTEITPEQKMPYTWGGLTDMRTGFSGFFQTADANHGLLQARVCKDDGTNAPGYQIKIRRVELIAYDLWP
jgi:hypothetical protein